MTQTELISKKKKAEARIKKLLCTKPNVRSAYMLDNLRDKLERYNTRISAGNYKEKRKKKIVFKEVMSLIHIPTGQRAQVMTVHDSNTVEVLLEDGTEAYCNDAQRELKAVERFWRRHTPRGKFSILQKSVRK